MSHNVTVVYVAAVSLLVAPAVRPQSFASARLARVFADMLENTSFDAFAAADPDERGRFVAALYIRGGPLLVVTARQPSVDAVEGRIRDGAYRDVYLDLQATPTPEGKFLVQDAKGDGLLHAVAGSGAVDIVYEDGTQTAAFNGDREGQHLSAAEYDARFEEADHRYAHPRILIIGCVAR